jgi:formate dehydrogenase maturation protein FdhE
MKQLLVLVMIIVLGIFFTTDPTPTIAEDTTDKTSDRCLYDSITENSNNKNGKNDEKKIQDIKHFCPVCNSNMLTFEVLSTSHGEVIQLVDCKICSFEWQETWTLPNWFWLKSSHSDHHWTLDRWNSE